VAREYPTVLELVGHTPIVRLDRIGRGVEPQLLAKLEYLNPGGSVKDRIGLAMIEAAERDGRLRPGGTIVEPTSGNTGVGLAIAAASRGYRCIFVMPDKMSQEKISMLRAYGADVVITPTAVDADSPESYYSVSSRLAEEIPGGFKPDQYSNMANPEAHYEVTGPEIWEQTAGKVDAFTCAIGTGGTLAGVAMFLKERNPAVRIVASDPMGAALYHFYKHGVLKAEGSSITEGIGQGRVTANLEGAPIDDAVQVTDEEALPVIFRLIREEGLVLGGSSGINVAGAVKVARELGPGHTVVTVLCDYGTRYQSKLFNPDFLREKGLPVPDWLA
jgi:cysteine synthase A